MPAFSRNLEWSLHRALAAANDRQHEFATVEHLLLALIDDADAGTVMRACNVDLEKLRRDLIACIESELEKPVTDGSKDAKPTEDFHRVIQRAVTHVQAVGREEVTSANVLVAILAERASRAVAFLQQQGATRYELAKGFALDIPFAHGAVERVP
jgi:ATP-dependent Clp protease ATP-binding subunit ClpA